MCAEHLQYKVELLRLNFPNRLIFGIDYMEAIYKL